MLDHCNYLCFCSNYSFKLIYLDIQVRDKGVLLASYKNVSKYRRNVIVPSMFPSGRSYVDAVENNIHSMEPEDKDENDENSNCEDALHSTENSRTPADEPDEVADFPLELCMRIMPHDQNTGAFFIAVFHKHSPLPGA